MKIFFFFLLIPLWIGLGGCSQAPDSRESNKGISSRDIAPPQPYLFLIPPEVSLWLNTREKDLGAYSVVILFDPSIVQVAEVKGGNAPFNGPPYVNREDFTKGKLRIMAYHTDEEGPRGQTLVARIQFKGLQEGISPLRILVETLSTPEGKPLKPRYFLSFNQVEVISRYGQ